MSRPVILQILKTICLAAVGTIPGLLMLRFSGERFSSTIVLILMPIIFALLSLPGVSGRRVARHSLATIVARNIPGLYDAIAGVEDSECTTSFQGTNASGEEKTLDRSLTPRERLLYRLRFFGLGMAILGPVMLVITWQDTTLALASYRWPTVEGVVEETIAKWSQNEKGNMKFVGRVLYNYEVSGEQYRTNITEFSNGPRRADRQIALADVSEYSTGMRVPVHYNPQDPAVAVFRPGFVSVRLLAVTLTVLLTMIGSAIVLQWFVSQRMSRSDTTSA